MEPILYVPLLFGLLPIIVLAVILSLLVYCIYKKKADRKEVSIDVEAPRTIDNSGTADVPYFLPAPPATIHRATPVVPYSVCNLKEVVPVHAAAPVTPERHATLSLQPATWRTLG